MRRSLSHASITKVVLALAVALLTVFSVLSHWLLLSHPVVWLYYSGLFLVGAYLIRKSSRERSSLSGVILAIAGLVILAFGVSFSDVGGALGGVQQVGGLIPPDAGISFGDGFTLRFYTDSYTYRVNTLGVLAGYLLFLGGLSLVEFEDA